MYKALVTDLDGTAVRVGSDGEDVLDSTRDTIRQATQAGYTIASATGRNWELALPVIRALGLTSPCVFSGGTQIIDAASGKLLWEKKLSAGDAERVLGIFKKHASDGIVITESLEGRPKLSDVHTLLESELYVYLLAVTEAEAVVIANRINDLDGVVAHLTPSWYQSGLVDIHATNAEATKEHAIKTLQKLNGIAIDETIGMGDSGNDIPIFQASGLKVAVSSATPGLLALADHIVPIEEADAVSYVIEKYLTSQS